MFIKPIGMSRGCRARTIKMLKKRGDGNQSFRSLSDFYLWTLRQPYFELVKAWNVGKKDDDDAMTSSRDDSESERPYALGLVNLRVPWHDD